MIHKIVINIEQIIHVIRVNAQNPVSPVDRGGNLRLVFLWYA
jgi:hypothetical protein